MTEDRERALNLLLSRYRHDEAMRLFGAYCLLLDEEWQAFAARHSSSRLRQLHRQLAAVGLWPAHVAPPAQGTGLLDLASAAMTGLLVSRKVSAEPRTSEASGVGAAEAALGRDPEQVLQSLVMPPMGLDLPPALFHDGQIGGESSPFHDAVGRIRYRLAQDLGFVFPLVHLVENGELAPTAYRLRINGETVAEGRLEPACIAALGPGLPPGVMVEPHPARPVPMAWLPPGEVVGYEGELLAPFQVLAEHLEDVVRRNAHRLFSPQVLDQLLRAYEQEIGRDTLGELFGRFMSVTELRLVLAGMLKAGYSVRNIPRIVDLLMTHYINYLASHELSMDETWKLSSHIPFFSTDDLTQVVCRGLGLPELGDRRSDLAATLERAWREVPPTRDSGKGAS